MKIEPMVVQPFDAPLAEWLKAVVLAIRRPELVLPCRGFESLAGLRNLLRGSNNGASDRYGL